MSEILIAQISDPHVVAPGRLLYGRIDTPAALHRALLRVNALRPTVDLVVVSGDLVDRGQEAEYRSLREMLSLLSMPCAVMPGNHDDTKVLRQIFPEHGFGEPPLCCRRIDLADRSVLLLDTTVPGSDGGAIDDARIEWLEANCPDDRPSMLFLHHPPFATGIAGMDAIGLGGADRLEAWLRAHRSVVALSCGHVHRSVFTQFAGIPATIAPSPAHQIVLDLAEGPAALAWTLEPGGLLLHRWQGERIVSHVLPVEPAPVHPYG